MGNNEDGESGSLNSNYTRDVRLFLVITFLLALTACHSTTLSTRLKNTNRKSDK